MGIGVRGQRRGREPRRGGGRGGGGVVGWLQQGSRLLADAMRIWLLHICTDLTQFRPDSPQAQMALSNSARCLTQSLVSYMLHMLAGLLHGRFFQIHTLF